MAVMCRDAGLLTAGVPPRCQLSSDSYTPLLQAGFGEIRLGCRAYVQFLFQERLRDRQFKNGTTAIQAFISGVLTLEEAGARLFSYLILSSTAANAFYDTSRLDPLEGLTVQNILKIVDERQNAFEQAALARNISSRPQLIRTWREFQWICTPLSITTDFNELALASVEGRAVDFQADARKTLEAIAPVIQNVRAFDPRKPLTPAPVGTAVVGAVNDVERKLEAFQVETIQAALCVTPDRKFGPATRRAIRQWRMEPTVTVAVTDEKAGLTPKEIDSLLRPPTCSDLGFKSAFERRIFHDAAWDLPNASAESVKLYRTRVIAELATKLSVAVPSGEDRITPDLRRAIQKKRQSLQLQGDYIDFQLFKDLNPGSGP
ncbi:hypothetical protein GV67_00055 [Pseudorhizobium pelagicum]|uniref:Uncharacterized protein n=1 Tax=Pseudorhizobium pelagicum TaxID=1509405 RepID=A0A922P0J3_9HYPH|nr:hypothetical protein GV68_03010 [Pseudorhizobium pelagicum]KEQ09119.1 hypothetical protein GV67_00055 [Pseudorhizobium pelagicum]